MPDKLFKQELKERFLNKLGTIVQMHMKTYWALILIILILLPLKMQAQDSIYMEGINYKDGQCISVLVVGDRIVSVENLPEERLKEKVYIAPGLIDLQINGFAGVDFSDQKLSVQEMRNATRSLWKAGVTSYLPTVITNEQEYLVKSFALLSEARKDGEIWKSVPGFHLEGPYISPLPGFRGAHLEKYIRKPDKGEFKAMWKAASGDIRLITVAPESEGALSFIEMCRKNGMVVSLGHHNGDKDMIDKAVRAGASLSTHLGNGCANMINRHNNPIWPQLANEGLTATVIADGHHLTREELICFYEIKGPERTVLISDALDLAGLPPGEYIRGERKVVLADGVVKYPVENVLAGAASPLSAMIPKMMEFTGCSLADAIYMSSTHPARLLGLKDLGDLEYGKRADIILFELEDGEIKIHSTMLAGKIVYSIDSGFAQKEFQP